VVSWAFNVATKATKENFVELGENARTLCHHALEVDQLLQVDLSQVAKFILEGDVTDADENLRVDFAVVGVNFGYNFGCNTV